MIKVHTIINNNLKKRQKHLNLSDKCIERGGTSTQHKGVLAQYLNTDIPDGVNISNGKGRILLCHACENNKCSNPKHLYWGTDFDNIHDSMKSGTRLTIFEYSIKKHGIKKAKDLLRKGNKAAGGYATKGITMSIFQKQKISDTLKKYWKIKKAAMM